MMKQLYICLIFLAGCKSSAVFVSPNEVEREKVVLLFRDQTKESGELTVAFENGNSVHVSYDAFIQFKPEGRDTVIHISLNNIAGYWHGSDFYALKKVSIDMSNVYRLLFVKRLTAENSRIQFYELYESGRGNSTGEPLYTYYVSLPSYPMLEAENTSSSLFIPGFDRKMSLIVADCPSLAHKILEKQSGYFIPTVSFNTKKHPDVFLRIISEYNQCTLQPQ
jgi:hypothetical protein